MSINPPPSGILESPNRDFICRYPDLFFFRATLTCLRSRDYRKQVASFGTTLSLLRVASSRLPRASLRIVLYSCAGLSIDSYPLVLCYRHVYLARQPIINLLLSNFHADTKRAGKLQLASRFNFNHPATALQRER